MYTQDRLTVFPWLSAFLVILALFLAACGGEADSPEPTAAPATSSEAETVLEPTAVPVTETEAETEAAAEPTAVPEEEADSETAAADPADGVTRPQTYTVVTSESSASYIVDEEFLSEALEKLGIEAGSQVIVGTTPGVNGEIQLNFDNTDPLVGAQFTVDMTGLQTDQNRRDNWLGDNAIQTNRYPQATFVANSATGLPTAPTDGEEVTFQLNGDLTVRETTIPVTFDVTATMSGETISGTAVANLNLTDLGITPPDFANTLTVADPFRIEVDLTAQR